jgi:hypothetical protein
MLSLTQIKKFFTVVSLATMLIVGISCTTTFQPEDSSDSKKDYTNEYDDAEKNLSVNAPESRSKKEPLILVHYMPWFEAPPVSNGYGFHWHQGGAKFDPYQILDNGCANIASHYYPLTGPYDTRDINVLEYQVALMKVSGIDGVIFDWYGMDNVLDYKEIQESTLAMINVLEKAGLKFAICYEDQSIGKMIEAGVLTKADALDKGKNVFNYMDKNWLSKNAYVKYNGRPVVLTFGPQYYFDKSQWDTIFSACSQRPYFITLEGHSENFADGSYNWFNMEGKKTASQVVNQLNNFYARQYAKPYLIATAYAEFYDIYAQAGGKSYGFLDYAEGKTFNLTLEAAQRANPDVIQIATWNDYGEGTIIEPTMQHGYEELEAVQNVQKTYEADFNYNTLDLRAPLVLYKLLISKSTTVEVRAAAREAMDALFADNSDTYHAALTKGKITIDYAVKPILQEPSSKTAQIVAIYDAGERRNLALGAPTVVNNKIYDFISSKAVDGDINTYWEGTANKYPNTFQIDLVSSIDLDYAVLKLNPQKIWGKRKQTIEVQTSNDGTNFNTLLPAADYSFDPIENQNTVVVQLNTKARYVKFVFTKNTGGTAGQIAECEVYAVK